MRIKSAISLTIAFSFILSGIYFAFLSPLYEYPNIQTILSQSIVLKPQDTSQLTFEGKAGMEINYDLNASYQLSTDQAPPTSPSFSVKVYGPDGQVIQVYDKVANYVALQKITVKDSGTHKIEVTNVDTIPMMINVNVNELKDPTRPLEPIGHWFIFMGLPIVGLGIWFAIVKIEAKLND